MSADNVTLITESGSGACACGDDGPPPLLLEVAYLMTVGAYASLAVLLLMCAHYIQALAQAATAAHAGDTSGTRFEAEVFCKMHSFDVDSWKWMRFFDWPWLEAEFEGDAFYNFVVTLILEAVLNASKCSTVPKSQASALVNVAP